MHYEIDPQFAEVLGPVRLEKFNQHRGSVYGLDSAFNLAYLNPAWFKFAGENGVGRFDSTEWSLGKNIFSCIPQALLPHYEEFFKSALAQDPDRAVSPMRMEYECSSPDRYREFAMHLYPLGSDGVIVAHSLLVEKAHGSDENKADISFDAGKYLKADGSIHQCANCRRVQNLQSPQQWDWIPQFVKNPGGRVSHGVCELCAHHYYLN